MQVVLACPLAGALSNPLSISRAGEKVKQRPNPVALGNSPFPPPLSFHSRTNLAKPGGGHFSDVIQKKESELKTVFCFTVYLLALLAKLEHTLSVGWGVGWGVLQGGSSRRVTHSLGDNIV